MSTVERIIVGVASLIALVGWLRLVGEAGSYDGEQHPSGLPKYQPPSTGQNSTPHSLPSKQQDRQSSAAPEEEAELPAEIRPRRVVSATITNEWPGFHAARALRGRTGKELKNMRTATLIMLSGLFLQVAHADEIRHAAFPNVMLGTWAETSRTMRRQRQN